MLYLNRCTCYVIQNKAINHIQVYNDCQNVNLCTKYENFGTRQGTSWHPSDFSISTAWFPTQIHGALHHSSAPPVPLSQTQLFATLLSYKKIGLISNSTKSESIWKFVLNKPFVMPLFINEYSHLTFLLQ